MLTAVGRVQIHLVKLRGDRNVPGGQATLIADLSKWTWGALNWQQFTLPICALLPDPA